MSVNVYLVIKENTEAHIATSYISQHEEIYWLLFILSKREDMR